MNYYIVGMFIRLCSTKVEFLRYCDIKDTFHREI